MSSLWLVPVDENSYQQTLAQPIDLTSWDDRPADFPEQARIWGVRTDPAQGEWNGNERHLEKMKTDDTLLFYRNKESRYDAAGRIGQFDYTDYIRDEYWNGGPALDIYTVKNYDNSVEMEPEQVNQLLGYKENYWPQGLSPVASDRPTDRVIRRLNLDTSEE